MKNNFFHTRTRKAVLFILILCLSALLLSSCYMEPDRTSTDDITVGSNNVPFESIVTPTPTATLVPTIAPTNDPAVVTQNVGVGVDSNVDWTGWDPVGTPTTNTSSNTNNVSQGITQVVPQATVNIFKATSIVQSTPKATSSSLKTGSEGQSVKDVQQSLKNLGYYTGSVDGKFGAGTATAVKAFQSANGLTADGIVGNATLARLTSSSAKTASQASYTNSSSSAASAPKVTSIPSVPSINTNIYLEAGDSSSNVTTLQNRLISLGYLAGTANGTYGVTTEVAVMAFQDKAAPYTDGVAGPDTIKLLNSSSAPRASSPVAVVTRAGYSLEIGDEGDAVRAMQKQLIKVGFLKGSADGSFGPTTKTAVTVFQTSYGLTPDGIAGQSTLDKLYADEALSTSNNSSGTTGNYNKLELNSSGMEVINMQTKLAELGYFQGNINGFYDSLTNASVREFQQNNGLTVTGTADAKTLTLLYSGTANSATEMTVSYPTLRYGDTSNEVLTLRGRLEALKYDVGPGMVYDDATKAAVARFQALNGLTADGVAGSATQSVLYSDTAKSNTN